MMFGFINKILSFKKYRRVVEMKTSFSTSEKVVEVTLPHGKHSLKFKIGKFAKMADGSAIAEMGNTAVLAAAVSNTKNMLAVGMVPLTVDYRQKAAAAGRIPTNFLRRELGPTEKDILTSRMIDRSLRPLFSKTYSYDTQITCNLLSVDGVTDADILSLNAASVALSISDIPWEGPVGAVRVGCIDNEFIINPTRRELTFSTLNLIVAAANCNRAVMLEGNAEDILQNDLMRAIKLGVKECQHIVSSIEQIQKDYGKSKRNIKAPNSVNDELVQAIHDIAYSELCSIFTDTSHTKQSRDKVIRDLGSRVSESLKEKLQFEAAEFSAAFGQIERNVHKELIFVKGIRSDGRDCHDLRPVDAEVDLYAPLHGSALFQRGQTQVLATVAFDSLESVLKSDPVSVLTGGLKEKNFMLHYEFPAFATNTTGSQGTKRREIGHGALAEKALRPVLPTNFPFTIRLTTEVLESNGSSSMASVCAGSLALMDAGVPIKLPVAGIAMGLLSEASVESPNEISRYCILTDINGLEDHMGDMDLKMAGSKKGLTAIQLDVKIPGIPLKILMESLQQGWDAKVKLINIMNETIHKPRAEKKDNWPVWQPLQIMPHQRSRFIGMGGMNLKKILAETGVHIVQEESSFFVFAPNETALQEAKEMIDDILSEEKEPHLEFGGIYEATIVEVKDNGLMIILYPNMLPTLLHNSQLDQRKISHPSVLGFKVGQLIKVKYFGRDPVTGLMRLSRKVLHSLPSGVHNLTKIPREEENK